MCNTKSCGCWPSKIAKILLIVGGLNWGLVGVGMLMGSNWNLVNMIFGSMATVEAVVYVLVGVSAVVKIVCCRCKKCMSCKDGSCSDGVEDMNK